MSRVHDALRRAELGAPLADETSAPVSTEEVRNPEFMRASGGAAPSVRLNIHAGMLGEVPVVPFAPAPESHLLDLNNSHETPAEEFRTLRTCLLYTSDAADE